MQDEKVGATRTEQIVHHATQLVEVIVRRRDAASRAEKDKLNTAQREKEQALVNAVKPGR